MQVDMTKPRGAVIATAFLRGVESENRFTIDSVIQAYCVSIETGKAERRAMSLHKASALNGFSFRAMVTYGVYTFSGHPFN